MNIELNTQVGALFKLVAHKGDGIPTRETDWFHNLVLDTGLVRMGVGTWIDRCCIGTGNSTPTVTQTALDTFKASTTTQQSFTSTFQTTTSPYYVSGVIRWRFGEGVAAGNISEVGMGWGNQNLWNRALVKDTAGNPTTITVLSDEYLDVISEIRVYPQQSYSGSINLLDKTGAVVSTHTVTGLPVFMNTTASIGQVGLNTYSGSTSWVGWIWTGDLGTSVTSLPSGSQTPSSNSTLTRPASNSCQAVYEYNLTTANFTHKSFSTFVNGLLSSGTGWGYKFQISPTITKTSSQMMTYTFMMSWGRYTP